ncbi:MAG TPA: 8-amino-7-oxononanoate synthase [Azospirillaceae bacterium]|nr:8-amino-7-oxononanoate synthase [Azospirillaceae bacterium]
MRSLDQFAASKLARLERESLRRRLVDSARLDGLWVERDGRRLLSFCCNDYLNLTHHPRLKAAATAALEKWGTGSGASRLVTGNNPLFAELEARLARLKGAEAACVFGSGYLANTGIIPTLVGTDDLILVDELAHACIWAGAKLSGATVLTFRHNDTDQLAELLACRRGAYRHALVATDGVFSMDGDLAPLPALSALCETHDAWLLTDDAHGIGVIGGGRGSSFAHCDKVAVPLQMGTLSKAVGGYGGYLCASAPVIDLIKTRARTLVYSTGLPPATVAAAIAALELIEGDPDYAALPVAKARLFTRLAGLPGAQSPIVPVIVGGAEETLAASRLLEREGFLVTAIRPPTVPTGTSRLRITFTAMHPDEEVARLAHLVATRVLPQSVEA